MRKVTLVLLALGLVVASTAFASNAVRISQIYGSGAAGSYPCDYVELFNSSCAPVNIGGWSLQYGSATGTFGGGGGTLTYANYAMIPAGATIPACGYYLIKGYCSPVGAPISATPDLIANPPFNASGSNGKFVLFSDQVVGRDCVATKASPSLVDLVGYGSANCYEGTAAAPAGVSGQVLVRAGGGRTDTDVNSADFTNVSLPYPVHNSTGGYLNPDCSLACFGACCLRGIAGGCILTTAAGCAAIPPVQGKFAIFAGIGTVCQPSPDCPTPASKTTWGQVKTIYR